MRASNRLVKSPLPWLAKRSISERHDGRWHAEFDGLDGRPAAFPRIRDERRRRLERRVVRQELGREVQQPRPDHRAVSPGFRDPWQVERKLALGAHQRQPFGVGLHHSVFDAVVDHLGEVPRARGAAVHPAAVCRRGQRAQHGFDRAHGRDFATHHQAVTVLQAPHAPGYAGIDEQMPCHKRCRMTLAVLVHRVGAVDDDIARRQQRQSRGSVSSVGAPAGNISQTTLGDGRLATSASSVSAVSGSSAIAARASAERSQASRCGRRARGGGSCCRPSDPVQSFPA